MGGMKKRKPGRGSAKKAGGARKADDLAMYASAFASRGGKARAKALSPKRRREIAKKATRARWRKK